MLSQNMKNSKQMLSLDHEQIGIWRIKSNILLSINHQKERGFDSVVIFLLKYGGNNCPPTPDSTALAW